MPCAALGIGSCYGLGVKSNVGQFLSIQIHVALLSFRGTAVSGVYGTCFFGQFASASVTSFPGFGARGLKPLRRRDALAKLQGVRLRRPS